MVEWDNSQLNSIIKSLVPGVVRVEFTQERTIVFARDVRGVRDRVDILLKRIHPDKKYVVVAVKA